MLPAGRCYEPPRFEFVRSRMSFDDAIFLGSVPNSTMKWLYLVWSVVVCGPAALALVMSQVWHPTTPATIAAVTASVIAGLNVIGAIMVISSNCQRLWLARIAATLGLLPSLAPVAVRMLLPWEEPETGDGSPLAVLIGLVFGSAVLYAVVGHLGVCCAFWSWEAPRRAELERQLQMHRLRTVGAFRALNDLQMGGKPPR